VIDVADAAGEAPGGAGVPTWAFASQRRDPGLDAAAEAPAGEGSASDEPEPSDERGTHRDAGVPNPISTSDLRV